MAPELLGGHSNFNKAAYRRQTDFAQEADMVEARGSPEAAFGTSTEFQGAVTPKRTSGFGIERALAARLSGV